MADKVIPLSRAYEAHGKAFSAVTLRSPALRDLLAIGEPVEVHPGPEGQGRYIIKHIDRIASYVERLVKDPGTEMIQDLDLVDALAIEEAVTGFFTDAHLSRSRPTSSSGAPASPPTS